MPDEQTPLAGTARVSSVRAAESGSRAAVGRAGGAIEDRLHLHDGRAGARRRVRPHGARRRVPATARRALGRLWAGRDADRRAGAGGRPRDRRALGRADGVAGEALRAVTLRTATGERSLRIGPGGTYVAALRGYPEDQSAAVTLRFAGGRVEHQQLGPRPTRSRTRRADRRGRSSATRWKRGCNAHTSGQRRAAARAASSALTAARSGRLADRLPRAAHLRPRLGGGRAALPNRATRASRASTAGPGSRPLPAPWFGAWRATAGRCAA